MGATTIYIIICVCVRMTTTDDILCSFVFMNNSLGLFCRLILRGAKLEECPFRDKQ